MKVGTLIYVQWVDSCSTGGWQRGSDAMKTTLCESVGWLAMETDDSVTVAGHRSETTDEWNGMMTIPKVAIHKVQSVAIGTRRKR